jgi:hypothetical protein
VALLGISDRTFSRLEAEGILTATTPGTGRRPSVYDAVALVQAYLRYRELKLTGTLESPRDRRDRSQAELNELRLARERGQLLPRADVIRDGARFIGAVTAKLRQLPARLARAGALQAGAERIVEEVVIEMQTEVTAWKTALDLPPDDDA